MPADDEPRGGQSGLGTARVLIIDDDETTRRLLQRALGRIGITEVRSEPQANQITAIVAEFDPHLVFLDLHMNGTDGFAALRLLAEHDPRHGQRSLVLLTGDSAPEVRRRATELGADEVVTKPFELAGLHQLVEGLLASNEPLRMEAPAAPPVPPPAAEPARRVPDENSLVGATDYRHLFESMPGRYLVLNPDLAIVTASDSYLEMTLTERDQIVGRYVFDVFPDEHEGNDSSSLLSSFTRVIATGAPDSVAVLQFDIPRPDVDGGGFETRHWSVRNWPVFGADGSVELIINQVEDVTEFVRLSQRDDEQQQLAAEWQEQTRSMEAEIVQRSGELQEANRQLRAANEAKNEFLSRVSHELRTPLTSILGFGELLSLGEIEGEQREWVETILRAGRHLLGLLNDVLDISRIETGDLTLSLEPVSVEDVLRDSVDLIRPLAVPLDVDVSSHVDAVTHRYVLGDRQRLRQVLINLLSNAVKYNRPGGSVTIEVTERAGDRLRLAVTDTGSGLDEDDMARLFIPFERLGASRTGVEGTGLGLVLSRRLVETMGGTIGVTSEIGTGSTFWLELAAVEAAALEEPVSHDHEVTRLRSYAGPKRVLYVEDMVANIRLIEEILKRRPDITLIPAMLGSIALDLAHEHQPDLVLLDVHLPDIDGHEVLRRLRADPDTRTTPVIVLSADATDRQLHRLVEAGADEYLTKPIAVERLLAVVDQLLGATEQPTQH